MSYDDDRPGMMRVHIAEQRAEALMDFYSRNGLSLLANREGLVVGRSTKRDLAVRLAFRGLTAPGYDRTVER